MVSSCLLAQHVSNGILGANLIIADEAVCRGACPVQCRLSSPFVGLTSLLFECSKRAEGHEARPIYCMDMFSSSHKRHILVFFLRTLVGGSLGSLKSRSYQIPSHILWQGWHMLHVMQTKAAVMSFILVYLQVFQSSEVQAVHISWASTSCKVCFFH